VGDNGAMGRTFDLDTFLDDCLRATRDPQPRLAVREVVAEAVADPGPVADVLTPTRSELVRLHVSDDLTVLKVVWGPHMKIPPHNHLTWACIGIYTGQEDNSFFRRSPEGVVPSGGQELAETDVALLGDDAIHAVTNPLDRLTAAIHVYGGDFFTLPRSEFDAETLAERPYDVEATLALFEAANAASEQP
jgi:predicted metal-dependent enzyme (double-stranded beta helix superfamily)